MRVASARMALCVRWPFMRGLLTICLAALVLAGCAEESSESDNNQGVDPTPERLDGSSSREFEDEDIERANNASQAVQDYCGGIESEAQRVGCLSHVDESDIP